MAVVKNRLKVFETPPDQETMAGTKPQTPLKPPIFGQNMTPALQKFMNKQNEVIGGGEGQGSVAGDTETWVKKSPNVPFKTTGNSLDSAAEQDENNKQVTSVNKSAIVRPTGGATKSADNRRGSQVVVPSIFKQEPVSATTVSESRRSSQVGVPEVFKQGLKNTSSETSTSDENKPKPTPKPGSAYPRLPAGPKPQATGALKPVLPGSSAHTSQSVVKKPSYMKAEEKPQHSLPRDSVRVKLPAVDHVSLKSTQPGSTASPSASQPAAGEMNGADFRNILKPAKVDPGSQATGRLNLVTQKPLLPPTSTVSIKVADLEKDSRSPHDGQAISDPSLPQLISHGQNAPDTAASQVEPKGSKYRYVAQELKRQSSSPLVERKSDSKKFKKVKFEAVAARTAPPAKPVFPDNIDLALVQQQYNKILNETSATKSNSDSHVADADSDVYDDGTSVAEVVRRESPTKRQSACISMIPDMTAEEEEQVLYDDGLSAPLPEADGLYVDAETERKDDELYEDEETFAVSAEKLEEDRKRRQKEEAEAKKKEEKERKEEEKKRKKEEKDRVKKEKEEMQLRKKFNLTGEEIVAGEGVIKQDVKAGVLGGLSLKKGQTVMIVRLDNNPPNKWLIRSDAGMGYVDSSIIEVDPNIIRQAMAGQARAHSLRDGNDEQPVYDDVPLDGHTHDAEDFEEIYEECP